MSRAGRSDTGVGTYDTPTLSEVDLGVGVKCRKSGIKSVGSPVLSSDISTLFEKLRRYVAFKMEMSSSYERVF